MVRPFPARELRDALGVVRLLYAARLASGRAMRGQPDALVEIGQQLRSALTYARAPEGSPEQRGAIECAAVALARLADVVTMDDSAVAAARAARARVSGKPSQAGRPSPAGGKVIAPARERR